MTKRRHTVLILDDDDAIRESLIWHFEDRDWEIISAISAEEALELIRNKQPDGAVVDIRLPGIDGNAFIHESKNLYPDMACVICTGSPEYNIPDNIMSLKNVSSAVFSKPVKDMLALEHELLKQIPAEIDKTDD